MKKRILIAFSFLFFTVVAFAQTYTNKQDVLNGIDVNIKSNPSSPLRGATLNAILKGVLNYAVDSATYKTTNQAANDYVTIKIKSDTTYLPLLQPKTKTDFEITDLSKGVILKSPNGNRWRLTINNDGSISSSSL